MPKISFKTCKPKIKFSKTWFVVLFHLYKCRYKVFIKVPTSEDTCCVHINP